MLLEFAELVPGGETDSRAPEGFRTSGLSINHAYCMVDPSPTFADRLDGFHDLATGRDDVLDDEEP